MVNQNHDLVITCNSSTSSVDLHLNAMPSSDLVGFVDIERSEMADGSVTFTLRNVSYDINGVVAQCVDSLMTSEFVSIIVIAERELLQPSCNERHRNT